MTRFYRVMHIILFPILWILYPFKVHGRENVPKDRAVVLCANHAHAIDPFHICIALPRTVPVRIMGKKELFEKPFLGRFLSKLGGFPVDRGNSDLSAVKTSIKTIKEGADLLVFPEGTRVSREGEVRAHRGVVMIAMRTGAPLLPVYVGKKNKLFHMTHIVFGKPFEPKTETRQGSAEEYQEIADEVVRRAYALGRKFDKK